MITVSIVSHGHGDMVQQLVRQLFDCAEVSRIILTRNIPEAFIPPVHPRIEIIENTRVAGFGANHNAAFQFCRTPYFCVVNPDITVAKNPFPALLECASRYEAALAAPLVCSPQQVIEDSIRKFPTPLSLVQKALNGNDGRYQIAPDQEPFFPEWIAGMFMLFRSESFRQVGGFDTDFFLYYEDVDICVRLWKENLPIVACPSSSVIHTAQRESHRNWRFMRWHFCSMMRYFYKHLRRLPVVDKVAL